MAELPASPTSDDSQIDVNETHEALHIAFPSFHFDKDEDFKDVDIGVDDIRLPSVQEAIKASIDEGLAEWERLNPIASIEMLRPYEQRATTQEYARIALRDVATSAHEERIQDLFKNLAREEECAAALRPCPMIQEFLGRHPPTRKSAIEQPPIPSWMFAKRTSTNHTPQKIVRSDSIYLVEVMHPSRLAKRSHFLLALGSMPLTTLADAIYCRAHQYLKTFGLHSKMLYMANRVFVDRRGPGNIDYSLEVRHWLGKHPQLQETYPGFDLPSLAMEDTTLNDLSVQVDAPSVFVHVGNCEHYIYIRNVRLVHDLDEPNVEEYPIRLTKNQHQQKCLVCQLHSAKYVTFDDPMAVDDPMYYCESCYYVAHYDANGKLMASVGNFKVFPYFRDD
ncbi:Aste57867_8285 [Aphanomyces stellatus]|uniref:Aste57867_8285 protein n=1 Tax=Aphanomyces stellatus TaxID=120398 RepID=A0A485KJU3_9STRA|nr:hypothetical protein As57867_008254 [Aphanomyces stellatus]VFT85172.1 Aste57867_8285 [Aphanomyces stellatus]